MFYFDLIDGQRRVVDDEGCDLPNLERAREEALAFLIDALRFDRVLRPRRVAVSVRGQDSEPLYEVELILKERRLDAGTADRVENLPRF
jgi:hypothetical protein